MPNNEKFCPECGSIHVDSVSNGSSENNFCKNCGYSWTVDLQGQGTDSAVSAADALLKYKELLDMGVLTPAEFEAKKKELLGLQDQPAQPSAPKPQYTAPVQNYAQQHKSQPQQPIQQPQYRAQPAASTPAPAASSKDKMPSQGGHLFLVVLGFILGIIWGLLSMGSYKDMKAAIASGDSVTANKKAKSIRIIFIIGMIINILAVIGAMSQRNGGQL